MSSELSPEVLAELGLERQPFTTVPRDEIFVDPGMQTLIERLLHNLTYGDMLLLLLGPPGSGKTALVLALLDHLPGRLELFIAKGQSGLSSERIVRDMLATYRAGQNLDFDAAFSGLHEHLAATARRNIPAALVIDDADQIETRQLEKLLELVETLNQALDAPLRVMLVGRPQLESGLSQLRSRSLREGRVFATQIRPFSAEQAIAFIAHRLHQAGAKREPPISDAQWERIYADACGLPGALQSTLAEHLNRRHAGNAQPVAPSKPRHLRIWPAIGLGVAILALLIVWWMPAESPNSPQPDLDQVELKLPPRPSLRDPDPPSTATTPAPPPVPSNSPPAAVTEPPTAPSEPVGAVTDTIVPTARPAAEPETTAAAQAGIEPAPSPTPQSPATAVPMAESQPAPASVGKDATEAEASADLFGADWLARQPAEAFTLQLLALGERDTVAAFAAGQNYSRASPAAIFRTTHRGGDWFVLVAGVYPDKPSARRALAALPAAVRRNGPWMRSFASIRAAIASAE